MKKAPEFGNLVNNAFDFLRKAGKEFEREPKYSIIHFYAALELLLKARLLREHWTLILTKPESADVDKFQIGNFHSVSLSEANKRLTAILHLGLTKEEFECFSELGDHRNRMVHFFHQGQNSKKKEIETIVSQQCRAWFYLHGILTNRWRDVFDGFGAQIAAFDKSMRKQKRYLKAKFEQLKGEIAARRKKGSKFSKCPSCGHVSLEEDPSDGPLLTFDCIVCNFQTSGVRFECAECQTVQDLADEAWSKCVGCGKAIEPDDVMSFLTKDRVLDKDDLSEGYEANCGTCGDYHSVIRISDKWFCTNCFSSTDGAEQCGWCSDLSTGDMEFSYSSGCGHCEGRLGHEKDD